MSTDSAASPVLSLYPLYKWLIFLPLAVLATIFAGILAIPVALFSPRAANLYIAVAWCRLLTNLTPVQVVVEGAENIVPGQSYVVVANHQSQFDIPLIYGYSGLDLRWVMKSEIKYIPFVAAGCRAIGHIFIDRSSPEQARDAINKAVSGLQAGTGILFFAEGTRSRSGTLLPFKKGAFRVAVDRCMPVLPMTVSGTRDVLPAGTFKLKPGTVRLQIHPPVSADEVSSSSVEDLLARTCQTIASALPH
jgi:1-acyl-sn-glycerol-3-phosphate acyltransferase